MVWREEKEANVGEVKLAGMQHWHKGALEVTAGNSYKLSYGWCENLHILSSFMQLWKISSSANGNPTEQRSPGEPKEALASSSENHVLVTFLKLQ